MTSQALHASRGWWPCAAGRDRLAREDIPDCVCWGTQHPSTKGHGSSGRGEIQAGPRSGCSLLALPCAHCSHVEGFPAQLLSLPDVTVTA